jgi:sugar (pentulose or hexulose) kinase
MRDVLLGLDLGTSSCKAGVVSIEGTELSHGKAPTPWRLVPSGAELDAADLFEAVASAVRQALNDVPQSRVVGVGVASLAEAGYLVDRESRPLFPAIAWFDSRGDSEIRFLAEELGSSRFAATTGLPLTSLCSLSKYAWLRRNHATARSGTRWFSLAEWLVWRLGGAAVSERSLASRTGFLDLTSARPWSEALDAAGAPHELIGDPVWAGVDCGRAASADPMLSGATLTVAGMDHLAAAIGVGITNDGAILDSCGTAEAFVLGRRMPVTPADLARSVELGVTVGWHVIPNHLAFLGALRSGAVLQRVLDLLGWSAAEAEASMSASQALPAATGLGESTLAIRGDDPAEVRVIEGGKPRMVWIEAVEAVASLGTETMGRLVTAAGVDSLPIVACGGWIRGVTAQSAKRRRLGDQFRVSSVTEAGTRGAALLAGVAARVYSSISDIPPPISPSVWSVADVVSPDV